MDPMVAFALARLDEAEALAKAATPGPWWHNPAKLWMGPEAFERYERSKGEEFVGYGGPHPFTGCVASTGPADDRQSMADAAHIAQHEPTRVLRAIAAKRLVVIEAAYWHDRTLASIDEPFPMPDLAGRFEVAYTMLRALLTEWDDHADYLPEWKP